MGRIQSSVGLITGVPISDTVNQLLSISARPRDLLASRTEQLKRQQVAIGELTALVISVQLSADKLGKAETFNKTEVTSSNSEALSATVTGSPSVGTYQLTPVQLAQTHQLLSAGLSSRTDPIGEGTFAFRVGGVLTYSVQVDADDSLTDLADKIKALNAGVTATVINDGSSGTPHRLSLVSRKSGTVGEITIDSTPGGLTFQEIAAARDAVLRIGDAGSGVQLTSSSNEFTSVIDGLKLTLQKTSADPVTVTVKGTDSALVANANLFVEQYNKLHDKLTELTKFNPSDNSTGILFGSNEALRIETTLSNLLSRRFVGAGTITSLDAVGISLRDDGKLALDSQKLRDRYAADPAAVKEFFTNKDFGVAKRFNEAVESLAGANNSLLINRTLALQRKIEINNERITAFNQRLDRERERLLKNFYDLENVIGKLQSSLTAITNLQPIPPLGSSSR
jgi:flagellar hook-associated protein 2